VEIFNIDEWILSTSHPKDVLRAFADTFDDTNQAVLFEIKCNLTQMQAIILDQTLEFNTIKNEQEVFIDIVAGFQIISVEVPENVSIKSN
jgi:hypothetical protein